MSSGVCNKRLAMAVVIVVALVVSVPVSGSVFKYMPSSPAQAVADGGIRAASIVDEGNVDEALGKMEKLVEADQAQLPIFFEGEIGLLDGARDVRVDDAGRVIGFLVDRPSSETFARIRENMARTGWSEISLGEAEGATFMKAEGMCTWTLVTCTQVGSATAVVYRCMVR